MAFVYERLYHNKCISLEPSLLFLWQLAEKWLLNYPLAESEIYLKQHSFQGAQQSAGSRWYT